MGTQETKKEGKIIIKGEKRMDNLINRDKNKEKKKEERIIKEREQNNSRTT
jgi:hypothetical protein